MSETSGDCLEHRGYDHAGNAVQDDQRDGKDEAYRDVAVLIDVDRQQLGRHVECDEKYEQRNIALQPRQVDGEDHCCGNELGTEEQPQRPQGLSLRVVTSPGVVADTSV